MAHVRSELLVSPEQLAASLGDPDLIVLDCTSAVVPSTNAAGFDVVTGAQAFREGHVPGAQFLDVERDVSLPVAGLHFTFPPVDLFAAAMTRFGVGANSRVILYSTTQPSWAARMWLMLRAFGFDNAAVLNGGWRAWAQAGLAVERGEARARLAAKHPFAWRLRPGVFLSLVEMERRGGAVLVNALDAASFRGEGNISYGRPGRIPGSVNVPTASLIDPETGKYLDQPGLEAIFRAAGIEQNDSLVAYCGAGVAASNVVFARMLTGVGAPAAVYDGSLLEWASDPARPLVTGE